MNIRYIFLLTLVLLLAAYANGEENDLPPPGEIAWEQVPGILQSGQVESIFQTHTLDITIYMEYDAQYHTVEPQIDDIFDEIEACGEPCRTIMIATE